MIAGRPASDGGDFLAEGAMGCSVPNTHLQLPADSRRRSRSVGGAAGVRGAVIGRYGCQCLALFRPRSAQPVPRRDQVRSENPLYLPQGHRSLYRSGDQVRRAIVDLAGARSVVLVPLYQGNAVRGTFDRCGARGRERGKIARARKAGSEGESDPASAQYAVTNKANAFAGGMYLIRAAAYLR